MLAPGVLNDRADTEMIGNQPNSAREPEKATKDPISTRKPEKRSFYKQYSKVHWERKGKTVTK